MRRAFMALVATLALALIFSAPAFAKRPPSDEDPSAAGELYGDLVVIERDGNGEPILREVTYFDPETVQWVTEDCQQPLAVSCALLPLWGEHADFDPELYDACAVQDAYLEELQEVSFGRGSVARAPGEVVDSAYAEFIKTINTADAIAWDPARRIMLHVPIEDDPGTFYWKTIDAPLENMGLYRETMGQGCLGTVVTESTGEYGETFLETHALSPSAINLLCPGGLSSLGTCDAPDATADLVCSYPDYGATEWWLTPVTPDPAGVTFQDMTFAASFIAASTDKKDPFTLGELIGLNTSLGLNTYTFTKYKKERILEVTYFDFSVDDEWFTYERDIQFPSSRLANLLVDTCAVAEDPHAGVHSFISETVALFDPAFVDHVDLDSVNLPVCRGGELLVEDDGVTPVVCDDLDVPPYDPALDSYGCGGADWFVQLAEHSRKTIWYVHNWEVPDIGY